MADDKLKSPRPHADLKGSIRGDLIETGGIAGLTAVGSFDTGDDNSNNGKDNNGNDNDNDGNDMLNEASTSSGRRRLYSEEDEEIRMAKAMAMAISNNPNLTPSEARNQVFQQFNKKDTISQTQSQPSPNALKQPSILQPIATALAAFKDDHNNIEKAGSDLSNSSLSTNQYITKKVKATPAHHVPLNPFANLQESMNKTRQMAQERFQEIVQGGAKPDQQHQQHQPVRKAPQQSDATPTVTNSKIVAPASKQPPNHVAMAIAAMSPISPAVSMKDMKKVVVPPPASPTRTNHHHLPMHLPNLQSITQSLVQTVDAETTRKLTKASIGFSSMVWKRRSGLGKYHGKNSWERRKLVIRGTNYVAYYKIDDGEDAALEKSNSTLSDSVTSSAAIVATATSVDDDDKKPPSWLEQAAMNLANKANINSFLAASSAAAAGDKDTPRGAIDLAKERATVAASLGHSGSPTPFCLSIKVRGETRWKLCFDTHELQMQWLAALTDLVVTCSVDLYNEKLLQKADPKNNHHHHHADSSLVYAPDGGGGTKKLWSMSKYEVRSFFRKPAIQLEEDNMNPVIPPECLDSDDDDNDDDGDEESTVVQGRDIEVALLSPNSTSKAIGFTLDKDDSDIGSDDRKEDSVWVLGEKDLYLAAAIINSALLFSHAGSTTPNRFWHIATFANLGLWYLLSKQDTLELNSPQNNDASTAAAVASPFKVRSAVKVGTPQRSKQVLQVTPFSLDDDGKVFKPRAGSTSIQVKEAQDSAVKNGHTFAKWRPQPGNILQVRSHGYKQTKKKVESPGSIYDCVNVDIFESAHRYPDMASRVVLPKVSFANDNGPKTWNAPDIFVISLSLPTEAPASVFAPSTDDGVGYTIAMYFVMRQDTRDILRRVTAENYDPQNDKVKGDIQKSKINAVKLFEEWVHRAPNDPEFMSRFKFVPRMQNVKEAGLPSWMAAYNGKPVLIKRPGKTGFFYQHPELSAMEFDISLHPFPYVAKQAFSYLYQNMFKTLIGVFGFVIESRDDDELPECLIGLTELCYPDPKHCQQGTDLFAGTSSKSHGDDDDDDDAK